MSLLDAAKAAHHDLGKYVRFEQRWLPEGASDAELLASLQADVLQTRRSRSEVESAPQLWRRLRPALSELAERDEVQVVDRSVEALEAQLPALERGSLSRPQLDQISQACGAISSALSQLVTSLKEG